MIGFTISGICRLCTTPQITQITSRRGNQITLLTAVVATEHWNGKSRESAYIPIKAWGHNADFIAKFFTKPGDEFCISGQLRSNIYTPPDGKTRYTNFIFIEHVGFTRGNKRAEPENRDSVDYFSSVLSELQTDFADNFTNNFTDAEPEY